MSKMSTPWQVLRDAAVFESFSLHLVMGSLITSGESLQVPDIGSGSANAMWYLAHSLHAFANFHGVKGALTLSRSRREKLFMAAECFANRATADDWHLRAMWVAMFMAWLIEVGKHETDKGNAMSGVVETILTSCKVLHRMSSAACHCKFRDRSPGWVYASVSLRSVRVFLRGRLLKTF